MQPPLVSVIMPVASSLRVRLARIAVNNFLRQHYVPFELIIVNASGTPIINQVADNASLLDGNHNTYEIACATANSATLKNIGLQKAVGPWVICVDDDDYFHPARLLYQMAHRRENLPCMLRYQLRVDLSKVINLPGSLAKPEPRQPDVYVLNNPAGIASTMLFPRLPDANRPEVRWYFDETLNTGEYEELLGRMGRWYKTNDFVVCNNIHSKFVQAMQWPLLSIAFYHVGNELTHAEFFPAGLVTKSDNVLPAGLNSADADLLKMVLQTYNLNTL
jgi:glycosyltransferase involved in cell wall biosynthesis